MNIGFDLDGIFVDKPPFMPKWLIEKLYKEKDDKILQYRIPGKLEQQIRKISHFPIFRPAITGNISKLIQIANNNRHALFLISSRFGFLKDATLHIEKKYSFPSIFKIISFNYENGQPHVFKNRLIKKLNINKYVDDDLSLLKFLAKENPQVIFYWLNAKKNEQLENNLLAITDLLTIIN